MDNIKKITLIEDDEVIVYLTKKIIKETNQIELLNVLGNGKQAIDYFIKNIENSELLPDIIFLDISMPIIDGWQFLEEFTIIRDKIVKPISIYITTSSISQNDINKAKNVGFISDFIIKPISLENFKAIIEKLSN